MKHLLFIEDDAGKRTVELQTASSSIGRDPSNSIVLNSREISRQHAVLLRLPRIEDNGHQFRIIDGNFQGKPSTNGLLINGVPRTSHNLCHGDEIIFAKTVDARYFVVEDVLGKDHWLSADEYDADYMATMIAEIAVDAQEMPTTHPLDESSLERLASFPELFPHPIIELSMLGELTYLNPAAIEQFPEITTEQLAHPLLEGVIEQVREAQSQQLTREVVLENYTFEQNLNYIPQSDLIRIYLLDITSRKQAEDVMKALHRKLEAEFEQKTRQFNDATDRLHREEKALVASYATNRALLNAIPDPMFRIDCKGLFVNFKTPKHYTLPFDPAACLDLHLSAVLPQAAAEQMQRCINVALQTEEIQVMDFQFPVVAGSVMTESVTAETVEPPLEGAPKGLHFEARIAVSAPDEVMVIFRDITERKQSEADIRHALERERELNEMKTRFVSMTSHEFRTPLTTIMSSAELLEYYSEQWDKTKQLQYLRKIKVATKHMIELLNDVLLINKTEAGKLGFVPKPGVLNAFCEELLEEIQITTTNHCLVLRSQLPSVPTLWDQKLMRHILTNLLSNAVNYSPHGGDVVLSMTQQEKEIVLSVTDAGIGIPEESLMTLFESFVRGSNVGRISGTGLGLAIVKKAVELHQGQIDCKSELGVGTTFTVKLPVIAS